MHIFILTRESSDSIKSLPEIDERHIGPASDHFGPCHPMLISEHLRGAKRVCSVRSTDHNQLFISNSESTAATGRHQRRAVPPSVAQRVVDLRGVERVPGIAAADHPQLVLEDSNGCLGTTCKGMYDVRIE